MRRRGGGGAQPLKTSARWGCSDCMRHWALVTWKMEMTYSSIELQRGRLLDLSGMQERFNCGVSREKHSYFKGGGVGVKSLGIFPSTMPANQLRGANSLLSMTQHQRTWQRSQWHECSCWWVAVRALHATHESQRVLIADIHRRESSSCKHSAFLVEVDHCTTSTMTPARNTQDRYD